MSGKFLLLLLVSVQVRLYAQDPRFKVLELSLPAEMRNPDHEFSGLCISGQLLFLLSESRLTDMAEGYLYAFRLGDLDHQLKDKSYTLPFVKIPVLQLEKMKQRIKSEGQDYEGLEAIHIEGNDVYLSVETTTQSSYAFLLKGSLQDKNLLIDTQFLIPVLKPVSADGSPIYNAGFESLTIRNHQLVALYEFNRFPGTGFAYTTDLQTPGKKINTLPYLRELPFRLTDITATGNGHYTGINYFYKGGGPDTIYRPALNDTANNALVKTGSDFHNYCRLVDITFRDKGISWSNLWEFPLTYTGYNWEGIAAHREGYFIINDRYTPAKPYRSTLIYLKRAP